MDILIHCLIVLLTPPPSACAGSTSGGGWAVTGLRGQGFPGPLKRRWELLGNGDLCVSNKHPEIMWWRPDFCLLSSRFSVCHNNNNIKSAVVRCDLVRDLPVHWVIGAKATVSLHSHWMRVLWALFFFFFWRGAEAPEGKGTCARWMIGPEFKSRTPDLWGWGPPHCSVGWGHYSLARVTWIASRGSNVIGLDGWSSHGDFSNLPGWGAPW